MKREDDVALVEKGSEWFGGFCRSAENCFYGDSWSRWVLRRLCCVKKRHRTNANGLHICGAFCGPTQYCCTRRGCFTCLLSHGGRFWIAAFLAFFWALIGGLSFNIVEPDTFSTFDEAFYFSIVTITTIGYGDYVPRTTKGRAWAFFYAHIGIMLFCMLSTFFAQEVAACCTSIPKSLQKKSLLFNFLSKFQIFLMFLSYVMVIAIGGIIFQSFGYSKTPTNEVVHWDFSEAFYFCWVTAATIGYGDFTIQSTSGRQWVNLFSIFGIAMLSLVLTQITSIKAYADKKIEEMRRKKEVPTLHPQITNLAPTLPPEMEDFLYATLDQLSDFDPAEQTHFLDIFQKLTTLNKDTTLKPHKDQEEDKEQEDQIELQLIK